MQGRRPCSTQNHNFQGFDALVDDFFVFRSAVTAEELGQVL